MTVDPPSLLANGGEIAYLDNHYGLPGVTPTSFPAVTTTLSSSLTPPGTIQSYPLSNLLAAVQIAIWDLEYNNGAATGLFNLTGFDPYHTSATDLAEIQDAAAVLVNDASGKSEQVAILNATSGNQSLPTTSNPGTQSVLAASTFDFFNKLLASPTINTMQQPASATVGSSIADKATVSGGNNPTGTVTFKLYNNSTASGTPLFTDTESLSVAWRPRPATRPTATGTDYWVATYNGDSNNAWSPAARPTSR